MTGDADDFREEVSVRDESDVGSARRRARELATQAGLAASDVEAVATAVTEIARNIVVHARAGVVYLGLTSRAGRPGVVVLARDDGPGIPDIPRAMQDGYSTAGGLGLGLPGASRLMDDFVIESEVGRGTTVIMRKWAREGGFGGVDSP